MDDDWRTRVEARITERGLNRKKLADEVGCSRSLITELLSRDPERQRNQTTYLPEIHAALGWDPPQPPLPVADAGEIAYIFDHLDEAGRASVLAAGRKELSRILREATSRSHTKKS